MKVSLNWMKWYGGQGLDVPIEALVERIGAQLGAVDEVIDLRTKYQGIIVARIISCTPHTDSDHLNVCLIDDGGKAEHVARDNRGYVQVVCGAANVREGLLVAWLPPGSTVPESIGKDPFVLGSRELRGVMSNGMLASPRELALGDAHEGIMELDGDIYPGQDFAEAYGLDDYIIDIENKMFTHRPDCFGQLGVAREIAGISGLAFTSPNWYVQPQDNEMQPESTELTVTVLNELPSLVSRFIAIPLAGVSVRSSPVWLQTYLLRLGVRPINNVVDVTNYIMLLTGQPMHAYDYDKVKALSAEGAVQLSVRYPRSQETVTLLNGKTIVPRDEAIMIATNQQLIGVGGVMGGADTEVDTNTHNIILEVATFDMYSVRRTSMAHGLFTDAVTRYNKGQSPLQNSPTAAKAVAMLRELAGAHIAGAIVDDNRIGDQSPERTWVHPPVPVDVSFINQRLGLSLSAEAMAGLLENVECRVRVEGEHLTVTAPFWRTDIETREDVVEEVGRLYGFDKLPVVLPVRSIQPAPHDMLFELKSKVRATLAKAGANEVLTYSFVHGDLLQKVGQNPDDAFQVGNALSPDLQYYRLSLTPSLLDKVHLNIKAGYDSFALFEIGKGHNVHHLNDDDGLPMEFEMLDLVFAASQKAAKPGAAFYEARAFLVNLAQEFGIQLEFRAIEAEEEYPVAKPYDHLRAAKVFVRGTNQPLGMVGEYKSSVRKALKLPDTTAGFGIGLLELHAAARDENKSAYVPLSRYPKATQDITFKTPNAIPYQRLYDTIDNILQTVKPADSLVDLDALDIYRAEQADETRNISLRIEVTSYQKTLTDKEVALLLDDVARSVFDQFGAERI